MATKYTAFIWPPLIFPVGLFATKNGGIFTQGPAPPSVIPGNAGVTGNGGIAGQLVFPPLAIPPGINPTGNGGNFVPGPAPPSIIPPAVSTATTSVGVAPATPTVNYDASVTAAAATLKLFGIVVPTYPNTSP